MEKDLLILDSATMAHQYIRPEKELLDFTNEDIDQIEKYYNDAYKHLDSITGNIN